jgi:hypothetical protein
MRSRRTSLTRASPKIVHVLLLGSEQFLESLARYPIHRPLSAAAEFFSRS